MWNMGGDKPRTLRCRFVTNSKINTVYSFAGAAVSSVTSAPLLKGFLSR